MVLSQSRCGHIQRRSASAHRSKYRWCNKDYARLKTLPVEFTKLKFGCQGKVRATQTGITTVYRPLDPAMRILHLAYRMTSIIIPYSTLYIERRKRVGVLSADSTEVLRRGMKTGLFRWASTNIRIANTCVCSCF